MCWCPQAAEKVNIIRPSKKIVDRGMTDLKNKNSMHTYVIHE
jgi:hypothetical protein